MAMFQYKAHRIEAENINKIFISLLLKREEEGAEIKYNESFRFVQTESFYRAMREDAKSNFSEYEGATEEQKKAIVDKRLKRIAALEMAKPVGSGFIMFDTEIVCPIILQETINFCLSNIQKFEYIIGLQEAFKHGLINKPPSDVIRHGRFVRDLAKMNPAKESSLPTSKSSEINREKVTGQVS